MAQNPVIKHPFTADPSIHRWSDGKFYIYGSHDKDHPRIWDMSDYHVFSSDDMLTWTDHGVVLDNKQTPWGGPFWAPDAAEKDGHYYIYFPEGHQICVADSPSPTGPFENPRILYKMPEGYVQAYDPAYFEWEGDSYVVFSERASLKTPFYPVIVKLSENLDEVVEKYELPPMQAFHEGPWIFFRNGKTYMLGGGGKTLRYWMADSPFGPYDYKGDFFFGTKEHTISKTAHGSTIEVDGQWYCAGHYDVYPGDPYRRTTVIEYMNFNSDGTIQPIFITRDGIKPISSNTNLDNTPEASKKSNKSKTKR
ncbi:MAG: family 43 glycosylhydrolase [Rikenellaceae bacterium]